MSWKSRSRIKSYLQSSLWIIPIGAVVIEVLVASFVHRLDARLGWKGLGFGLEGARAMANAVITLTLSFVVFTFGSLLIAVQVASGQYTPRIIATTLLRNNVIRYTVGLFVFALLFAIKAQNHLETTVPQLVTFLTGLLGLICLAGFLFLIDYAARLLRPVSLVRQVGDRGLLVLENVYPDTFASEQSPAAPEQDPGPVERTILHHGTPAIILAVNVNQLVALAKKANGVIAFVPQVGDFVSADEPLFLLHAGAVCGR